MHSQPTAPLRNIDLVGDHPATPAPIYHQIPAELQARRQWVCWAWGHDANGKWTKQPYNPRGGRAKTNAPRTWGTFQEAKRAYLENPIGLAGIGYVFAKDDPFCGADFDHCRNPETGEISAWAAAHIARLRAAGAYIEISVSGTGVHAIVRAVVGKGVKKTLGEVYDRGRYFTMSGRALDPTPISDAQAAIDALCTELRGLAGEKKPARDGIAGAGDRAALAAVHEADFELGRQLQRTSRDLILKRFLLATKREGTQGHCAARALWAEMHQRWPVIGLYRADGVLDESQCRSAMARAIYGRGFSFPEYTVIMSYHFAAYCLAKWGTKQAWREELAALWQNAAEQTAYTPKAPTPRLAGAKKKKPVGRSSNHASQVEKVYQLLVEHRVGDKAIIKTAELAAELRMHRVTLSGILAELRDAKRIATQRLGQYGGLVVTFADVAIVADQPIAAPPAPLPIEETRSLSCVSSESREASYSPELPDLAALAAQYLDAPPAEVGKRIVNAEGMVTYRRTAQHFADLVTAAYADISYADALAAYRAEQQRRKQAELESWRLFFLELKAMTNDELIAYISGRCRAQVVELARERHTEAAFDIGLYKARLKCAKQHLAWRGLTMPARATKIKPVTPAKPKRARLVACQQIRYEQPAAEPAYNAAAMIARLKARQAGGP